MKSDIARCTCCGKIKPIVRRGTNAKLVNGSLTKTVGSKPFRHCQDCIDADDARFAAEAKAAQEQMRAEILAAGITIREDN